MKLKFLALSIIFLATIGVASAASVEVTSDPVRDIISSYGVAKINLVIDNMEKTSQKLTLTHSSTDWTVSFSEDDFSIPGEEQDNIEMEARPPKDVTTGSHIITV